jgi:geranylgeranyl pyrophosphate synthase
VTAASLEEFLRESRARIEAELERVLPRADEPPARLHEAMRYAVLGGGKRLRPVLAFAAARACGAAPERALPVAAAVELVHAYSLVHDDLPAMDDDDERRGRPTVHVKYGEATAVLVGDALQALAFECLGDARAPAEVVVRLARAAGSRALVGGQVDDLAFEPARASDAALASIHERKTAALFGFALWGAGRLAAAPTPTLERLDRFARHYGLAFQLADDLADADPGECSALALLEPEEVARRVRAHVRAAAAELAPLGPPAALLVGMAEDVSGRLP